MLPVPEAFFISLRCSDWFISFVLSSRSLVLCPPAHLPNFNSGDCILQFQTFPFGPFLHLQFL